MSESEYITVKQIAKLYGTTGTTVRTWLRNGYLPGQRNGDYWVVKRDELPETVKTRKNEFRLKWGDAD